MPAAPDTFSSRREEPMQSDRVIEITDLNFAQSVLSSPVPVLVDFTAVWCAPCRALAPHVAAVAEQYQGRLLVGTCDSDGNPELSARLDVRSLPTLLLFKGGEVVGQIVGAVPRARIEALIARALPQQAAAL
jgi:thioredoxin 1